MSDLPKRLRIKAGMIALGEAMSDLPKRLRIKASMIALGERIPWGSDTATMEEAADMIEALSASIENHQLHMLGIARERDALAAELAAIKGQGHAAEVPDTVSAPRKLLAEAERIIDSYAEALKQCHAPGGDWAGEEAAQDDYEHEAGVASELRAILAIAQIQERNQ